MFFANFNRVVARRKVAEGKAQKKKARSMKTQPRKRNRVVERLSLNFSIKCGLHEWCVCDDRIEKNGTPMLNF